jgi:hypothetical protein
LAGRPVTRTSSIFISKSSDFSRFHSDGTGMAKEPSAVRVAATEHLILWQKF